jgi:DNA helicase-4
MLSNLNEKQSEAVLDDSKRLLILAGAGSGKTKTLTQKIEFLVKQKAIESQSILGITFTKNAALEMMDRLIINNDPSGNFENILGTSTEEDIQDARNEFRNSIGWLKNLSIVTFHSLCYKIMRQAGVKVFDNQFKILADPDFKDETENVGEETPSALMRKAILQCASEDQDFLIKLKWYLINHLEKKGVKKQVNENNKNVHPNWYISLRGDQVKSKSEVFIADWLFRHGIEYKYEIHEQSGSKDFYPDFYIPAANLYIEHKSEFSQGVAIKRDILRFRHSHVAITNESETHEITAFSLELDKILRNKLSPESNNIKVISVKEALSPYEEELTSFIKIFKTALDMIKVEGLAIEDIVKKGKSDSHERVCGFYTLFEVIQKKYNKLCVASSYLDFNDLVIRAIELLKNHPDVANEYRSKFKYILVDEFQDVNKLQVDLLKLLATNETQLFCVGDDWQSIYGFRGSDVGYIVNFNQYFPDSKVINLDLNYRSTQTIVSAGNEVMKKNQLKVPKELHAINKDVSKINLYVSNKESEDGVKYVRKRIEELKNAGVPNEEILILARRSAMLIDYRKSLRSVFLKISCRTIHSSKGLEAKIVFLVGMKEGSGGFPDFWLNDRIYQVIRPQDLKVMEEEERRLFYVAITRAKQELNLITQANCESSYIKEIPSHFLNRVSIEVHQKVNILTCPNCNSILLTAANFCSNCGTKL